MIGRSAVVLGLPGAGKSTYLAALWHTLESASTGDAIALRDLAGDRGYLNGLRDDWLSCTPVSRNLERTSKEVELRLTLAGGHELDLSFPDHSGELFRDALVERTWPDHLDQLIEVATSAVLFIHAFEFEEPVSNTEVAELVSIADTTQPSPANRSRFTPDNAPTQSKLVDLLQIVSAGRRRKLRLAVVLSAWDLVPDPKPVPSVWLSKKLPLLAQYIEHNEDFRAVSLWGISAQGGDYGDTRELLLAETEPGHRCLMVDDNGEVALADPLVWMLRDTQG